MTLDIDYLLGLETVPASTLVTFGAMSRDHDALDRVAQVWHQEVNHPQNRWESARP